MTRQGGGTELSLITPEHDPNFGVSVTPNGFSGTREAPLPAVYDLLRFAYAKLLPAARWLILLIAVLTLSSCAPNRAQWMNQAAQQQAKGATESIGTPDSVRAQAAQGAVVLNSLAAVLTKSAPPAQQQVAAAFANDAGEVSSGLHAIAETRDDAQFTNAVFAMCQPTRREAAPRVGRALLIFAGGFQTNPPPNMSEQDRANAISYLSTFGERLIDIPAKCDQAGQQLTEASAEEQQAEVNHAQNVNKALTAAAVVFLGTAMVAGEVGAAAATRPPVVEQNNYYYGQ